MTIHLGYILGHFFECVMFVFYANTSFRPRKSYLQSILISLCGYAALFSIGLMNIPPISVLCFFIINTTMLIYCYNVRFSSAAFYSLMLDVLSCIGEYLVLYLMGFRYFHIRWDINSGANPAYAYMMLAIVSKALYFIGILILKRFTPKNDDKYGSRTPAALSFVPLLTVACLTYMMSKDIDTSLFLILNIIFFLVNLVTYYINMGLNNKNRELKMLQDEYNRNKEELYDYRLLTEKYENTKIMRHDFHKHLDVLKELMASDNAEAGEYMKNIRFAQRELDYTRYTDNKILNILLAQKVKEAHDRGVEIHIRSKSPTLGFIADIDVVAIFSNMLDNAAEAAQNAEIKEVYVDLYTVNKAYTAIRVENYTDKAPVAPDGELLTQKPDAELHGMGIKSINNALKKYGSEMTWEYDGKKKFFRASAIIHIPPKNNI